jgi:hypothetical protein
MSADDAPLLEDEDGAPFPEEVQAAHRVGLSWEYTIVYGSEATSGKFRRNAVGTFTDPAEAVRMMDSLFGRNTHGIRIDIHIERRLVGEWETYE